MQRKKWLKDLKKKKSEIIIVVHISQNSLRNNQMLIFIRPLNHKTTPMLTRFSHDCNDLLMFSIMIKGEKTLLLFGYNVQNGMKRTKSFNQS